jgi:hypothetical protein
MQMHYRASTSAWRTSPRMSTPSSRTCGACGIGDIPTAFEPGAHHEACMLLSICLILTRFLCLLVSFGRRRNRCSPFCRPPWPCFSSRYGLARSFSARMPWLLPSNRRHERYVFIPHVHGYSMLTHIWSLLMHVLFQWMNVPSAVSRKLGRRAGKIPDNWQEKSWFKNCRHQALPRRKVAKKKKIVKKKEMKRDPSSSPRFIPILPDRCAI